MANNRILVQSLSFDRGVNLNQLSSRFGITISDKTLVFDSLENAEEFARQMLTALHKAQTEAEARPTSSHRPQ